MDAGRIWLVATIATVSVAIVAAQSSPAAGQSGWSGAGSSTSAPPPASTYTQPGYDRYGAPLPGNRSTSGSDWSGASSQQMSAPTIRTASQPAYGTSGNQSGASNSFGQTPSAPTTNSNTRGSSGPPPWPTSSPASTTQNWSDTPSTGSSSAPSGSGWSSIGSGIAAPPLLIPQLSTGGDSSSNSMSPVVTASGGSGPNFPASPTARQDNTHSVLASPSQQTTTNRSATDDWASPWNNNPDTSRATIGHSGSSPARTDTGRDFVVTPAQTAAASPPDANRTTPAKSNDLWTDDPWGKQSPNSSNGQGGLAAPTISAGGSKPPSPAASNPFSFNQPPLNSPVVNPATIGAGNVNVAGPAPAITQPTAGANVPNHNQPAPAIPAQPQPWVAMIASVLALAGSLAANFFLGWSYLDARQKYQSLVRRTADTFRRTKQAAA